MRTASQTLFAHVVTGRSADIELDVAALLLGDWEREHTDVAHYTDVLDGWARRATELDETQSAGPLSALNQLLFSELGFCGNQTDYYDRRNNFLVDVIERRTGMPIALSVVYVEVARRMRLEVHGVGFPGHFLVRYDGGETPQIIDPFRRGRELEWTELGQLLRQAVGARVPLTWSLLQPTGKRQILIRMLRNLAGTYQRDGDIRGCIEALERIAMLEPDNASIGEQLELLYRRLQAAN